MDVRAQSLTVAQGQRPTATPSAVSGPGSTPATSPTMARDTLVLSRQVQAATSQPDTEALVTAPAGDLRAVGLLAQPVATATVDALPVPAAATPAQPVVFSPVPDPITGQAPIVTSKDLAAFVTNVDLVPPIVPNLTLESADTTSAASTPPTAPPEAVPASNKQAILATPSTPSGAATAQTAPKSASNQAPAAQHPICPPESNDVAVPAAVQQKYPELTHALQGILKVRDADQPCVQEHLSDLSLVPSVVYEKLRKANLREIEVSAETVPSMDFNENLKGVHPRGWPEGKTWDSVAGLYNPSAQAVSAGNGQEGSVSLPLHELGHAIGGLLKYDNDPRLIEAHTRLYPKLEPYFQQDGPGGYAGRQELLAEGIAFYLKKGEQAAVAKYDQGFVDFLKNVVLA